jgi:hypothetical protein
MQPSRLGVALIIPTSMYELAISVNAVEEPVVFPFGGDFRTIRLLRCGHSTCEQYSHALRFFVGIYR